MTRFAVSVAALVLATALPACAADPALESAATVQNIVPGYEEVWRDGQQDEAKGLKALAKADAAVAEERARVLEGERMIAEGSAGVEAQRSAYKKFSSRTGAATSAKEAKIEADSLTSIVKSWEASEALLRKGTKIAKDARSDLAKAEKNKRKAEEKIAKARENIMRATVSQEEAPIEISPAEIEQETMKELDSVE